MKYNSNLRKILDIIFSGLFVLGLNYYFFENNGLGVRSIFNIIFLLLCFIMYSKNNAVSFKEKKLSFIFSLMISASLVIGKIINAYNDLSVLSNANTAISTILMFIGFSKFFQEFLYIIFKKLTNVKINSNCLWKFYNLKHIFLIIWIIIFISWIPAYLAYYPGILAYDIITQSNQALGYETYSTHHPPLHTFIWQLCLNAESTFSINPLVLYSITQMLFLSFAFARLIKFLIDKKVNNWIILASILFFTINPVIAIFSFIMTKDIYFTRLFYVVDY